jgi:OOP family OmpA-OmpF porin
LTAGDAEAEIYNLLLQFDSSGRQTARDTYKDPSMIRILLLCVALVSVSAQAEDVTGVTIYPHIGHTTFENDRFDFDSDNHWGLGVGYRFNGPWALELVFQSSEPDIGKGLVGEGDVDHWRLDALYHLDESFFDTKLRPFLSLGAGNADYDSPFFKEDESHLNVGAGFKWALNPRTSLRSDLKFFNEDDLKLAFSVGLEFALGSTAAAPKPAPRTEPVEGDADRDGVLDSRDECPNTPAGVSVDRTGCPLDSDRDGVYDYRDQCPDTPRGAMVDAKGCHKTLEKTVSITLNIEFDFDSSEARTEHAAEVRKVANFMRRYADSSVTMEGHTDSRGNADYNQGLSERRAKTIADMLISDFSIDESRVSSRGLGESQPIAGNDTDEGRQRNRRVVAVVEGQDKEIQMK